MFSCVRETGWSWSRLEDIPVAFRWGWFPSDVLPFILGFHHRRVNIAQSCIPRGHAFMGDVGHCLFPFVLSPQLNASYQLEIWVFIWAWIYLYFGLPRGCLV
jgi:hypothetical protein